MVELISGRAIKTHCPKSEEHENTYKILNQMELNNRISKTSQKYLCSCGDVCADGCPDDPCGDTWED